MGAVTEIPARVRAVTEARLAFSREYSGLHEFDGEIQDLSPDGVREATAGSGGAALSDPLDDATVAGAEASLRTRLGDLEMHRRDPFLHVEALDLTSYERDYAPVADRMWARRRHLAQWPDAIDAAITRWTASRLASLRHFSDPSAVSGRPFVLATGTWARRLPLRLTASFITSRGSPVGRIQPKCWEPSPWSRCSGVPTA